MDRYKFRAWHRLVNQWCYTGDYHRNLSLNSKGEWVARFDRGGMDFVEDYNPQVYQFTGLCDRNGKEIFEGDIVSSPHFEDAAGRQHKLYHIVEWSSRHHGWFLLNKSTMDARDGSIQLFVADSEHLTVSGTIHDQGESQ